LKAKTERIASLSSTSSSLGFRLLEQVPSRIEQAGEREREREKEKEKMSRSLGIPVKLLHEAAGHIVTVELKTGELYRGSLIECEDNWNCQLENITFTSKVIISFFFWLVFYSVRYSAKM
jgi:small nuclear ribonucleoprotein (snRNP)-like protein